MIIKIGVLARYASLFGEYFRNLKMDNKCLPGHTAPRPGIQESSNMFRLNEWQIFVTY